MRLAMLIYKNPSAYWDDDNLNIIDSAILIPGTLDVMPFEQADADGGERRLSTAEWAREELSNRYMLEGVEDDLPAGLTAWVVDVSVSRSSNPDCYGESETDYGVTHNLHPQNPVGEWWRPAPVPL